MTLIGVLLGASAALYAESHPDLDVVILGDSNTSIGGDDCSGTVAWSHWFANLFEPRSIRSFARSGATWTNTATTRRNPQENIGVLGPDNVIYNQVVRLIDAVNSGSCPTPALILISAGTNDAWFASKRPGIWDKSAEQAFANATTQGFITQRKPSTVLSLAESVRYNCELLMEAFPSAQIILLAPQQSTAVDHALLTRAADLIEESGAQMGIGTIRQDRELATYRAREPQRASKGQIVTPRQRLRTSDGTHTNAVGARRAGRFIARRVESMLDL